MTDSPIPEEYRRKALFAALYHHDGIGSYAGGEQDGDPIRVEFRPANHPDAPGSNPDAARRYVKRVAGALGFSFASEGAFRAKLTPDIEHALAGMQNEYGHERARRERRAVDK